MSSNDGFQDLNLTSASTSVRLITGESDPLDLEHNPFADSTSLPSPPATSQTNRNLFENENSSVRSTQNDFKSLNLEEKASVLSNAFGKASVSIASPKDNELKCSVLEPLTVGEGMNKYTTYKVAIETSLPQFKSTHFSVQRRYNEFLWLYQQLLNNNPGVIVPPAPEKHALGRFEEDFVENRRILLDRMLKKISVHPILSKDPAFKAFLESENLQSDMQDKKQKSTFMAKFNDAVINATSGFGKVVEIDEWFDHKKDYIDNLENQLKNVAKAVDNVIKNREMLADCVAEFGDCIIGLATSEINKTAEEQLRSFGEVQKQIKTIQERQAVNDVFYLGNTLDEYIRIIGSIKNAMASRLKAYQTWQLAEQALTKNRISLEKTKLNPKTKSDKVAQIESDILEGESRVVATKKEFEDISKLLKEELEIFEREKIEDVQSSIQNYLECVLKNQLQIVATWEAYLKETDKYTSTPIETSRLVKKTPAQLLLKKLTKDDNVRVPEYMDDLRIVGYDALLPPMLLSSELPLSSSSKITISKARIEATKILKKQDDRLIVIVGPCSIHDTDAAIEYASKIKSVIAKYEKNLLLIMRTYFEKPRTTIGWKGLINDPFLDGSFQINSGLRIGRKLLCDITDSGVPVACELLDTISPQFMADLVSWGAIGARTTESQLHRELASGVSFPVGFKNGTYGNCDIAIDAMKAAAHPHHFLGVTHQGLAAITRTSGNELTHVILRGGKKSPNYDSESVRSVKEEMKRNDVNPLIMVDASHGNSQKQHKNQSIVVQSLSEQLRNGEGSIVGVMIESHLVEGAQKIPKDLNELVYGQSITDACVNWETTLEMLDELSKAVEQRRLNKEI